MHGNLRMRLYQTLQTKEPMKIPGSQSILFERHRGGSIRSTLHGGESDTQTEAQKETQAGRLAAMQTNRQMDRGTERHAETDTET